MAYCLIFVAIIYSQALTIICLLSSHPAAEVYLRTFEASECLLASLLHLSPDEELVSQTMQAEATAEGISPEAQEEMKLLTLV